RGPKAWIERCRYFPAQQKNRKRQIFGGQRWIASVRQSVRRVGENYFSGCPGVAEETVTSDLTPANGLCMPSRSSPRSRCKVKKGPPWRQLRRDSLRSPLRCERRLGGEGFEPPTLSV